MIRLSKRQIGDADRVGGIELMIRWPAALGPAPHLDPDHEREAESAAKAYAERLVGEACRAHQLVPVHVRIACVRCPPDMPEAREYRAHLAVTIIGRRWVHATTTSRGRATWAR